MIEFANIKIISIYVFINYVKNIMTVSHFRSFSYNMGTKLASISVLESEKIVFSQLQINNAIKKEKQ